MANDDDTIDCDAHGPDQLSAIVCCHMISSETPVGFVENSDEPDDQQAWCDACEAMYLKEKSLTKRFQKFCDIAVVCVGCYDRFKRLHSRSLKN